MKCVFGYLSSRLYLTGRKGQRDRHTGACKDCTILSVLLLCLQHMVLSADPHVGVPGRREVRLNSLSAIVVLANNGILGSNRFSADEKPALKPCMIPTAGES